MKLARIHAKGDLRLDEVDGPQAGPTDVLVRVDSVGICGTDLGYVASGGMFGRGDAPMPIGHEIGGTISAIGEAVRGFAVGDVVVVNPLVNNIGNGGEEGGFARELLIRDVVARPASLTRLPDCFPVALAGMVEPLGVAMHGLDRGGARAGEKLAVFGAGPIGLCTIVAARDRGIDDIVVFDLSPYRRERALALGASAVADPREAKPGEVLGRAHGSGMMWNVLPVVGTDLFVDAAGAPGLIAEMVGMAGKGARIAVVAAHKQEASLHLGMMMAKELSIITALGYPEDFAGVVTVAARNLAALEQMVSHRFAEDDLLEAFQMAARPDQAAKVMVSYA